CSLANNHTLDWGYQGLAETTATLDKAGVARAGAGRNRAEAASPSHTGRARQGARTRIWSWFDHPWYSVELGRNRGPAGHQAARGPLGRCSAPDRRRGAATEGSRRRGRGLDTLGR